MDLSKLTPEDSLKLITRWREQPLTFSNEALGGGVPWQKQVEIMESVRDNRRTVVRSGHSVGKTFISARTAEWFLQCFQDSIIITTAPTFVQVEKILWGEIRSQHKKSKIPLAGEVLTTQIKISDKHFAIGLSTDQGDRLQGFHSKYVLIIVDEACGVEEVMFEAIEGLMTDRNCRLLLIGNPTSTDGHFYKAFKDPSYNKMVISCLDSPNVVAGKTVIQGLVGREWVEEKKIQWGEDSNLYRSRVLGEFPESGDDILIPLWMVENAENTVIELQGYEPKVLTIDVARGGKNDTVWLPRIGNVITLIDGIIPVYGGGDPNYVLGKSINLIEQFKPDIVIVDDTGCGWGIRGILEDRYPELVYAFNGGENAIETSMYVNIRAESYWHLEALFSAKAIQIPKNTRLTEDIPCIKKEFTEKGLMKIKSKFARISLAGKKITAMPSKDFADCAMMSQWGIEQVPAFEPKDTVRHVYGGYYSEKPKKTGKSRTGYG